MRINFLVALGVGQAVLGFCSLQGLTGTHGFYLVCAQRSGHWAGGPECVSSGGVAFSVCPFKSETWAAVGQRTQRYYRVSASPHTLINSPHPYPPNQQQGSWRAGKVKPP